MYFAPFVFASLVVSAAALVTPHHGARIHHRHADIVKARAPAPEPAPILPSQHVSKRGLKKRCKARPTTSSLAPTSSGIGSGVGNVAGNPSSVSTTQVEVTPTSTSSSSTSTSTKAHTASSKAATTQAEPTTQAAPPTQAAPTSQAAPTTQAAPTSTKKTATTQKTATSSAAAPTSSGGASGGCSNCGDFSGDMTGQGTWYDTGLTACGVTNNDNQFIAAVSELLFDSFPGATANPNNNPVCNKQAEVTYQGKTITVTITDRCTACAIHDLDFTPAAFSALADPSIGRISGVEWHFIN